MPDTPEPEDNSHVTSAARRLSNETTKAIETLHTGASPSDIEHLMRVLSRVNHEIHADNGLGLKLAISHEDASHITARAEQACAAIHSLFLTAERLLGIAQDIKAASDDLRDSVERADDSDY